MNFRTVDEFEKFNFDEAHISGIEIKKRKAMCSSIFHWNGRHCASSFFFISCIFIS